MEPSGAFARSALRNRGAVWALLCVLAAPGRAGGDPIRTRYTEATSHGVLVLTDTSNEPLAHGELIQREEGKGRIWSRMVIRFDDGSLYDETVRFAQRPRLRLLTYALIQRGPSFAETSEISFDHSGRYRARVRKSGRDEETASGSTTIPEDASNGLTSLLLKNLPPGASGAAHMIAFTPEPHLLELHFAAEGRDRYWVGSTAESATRFLVEPRVPGFRGAVASIVGKQPPSFRMWLTPDPAPALVKFEGPLYADGPVWRITPAGPNWKK